MTTGTTAVCLDCGGIMELFPAPQSVFSFKIPFAKFIVEIVDYDHEEYICVECRMDEKQRPCREAYEAGQEDGYKKGSYD